MGKHKDLTAKEIENLIYQLRGVANINSSNLALIIDTLGPSFDRLVVQIHKQIKPEAKANSLITIILEFYTKFGIAIQSRSLLKYLKTNKLTLCQYNPKHKSLMENTEFPSYAIFSSGTNETGELDVSAKTEMGQYFGFSAKANKIKLNKDESFTQTLAFGELEIGKMGEFKTTYDAKVSAIVGDKSCIRIPSSAPEVADFLIDRQILNDVVKDCYIYAQEAIANKETVLQRLNKGAIVKLDHHQEKGTNEIVRLMLKYKNNPKKAKKKINRILVNYHPRSGKIILTLAVMKAMNFRQVLVLTQFPYLNQEWVNVIKRFAEFSDIEVINIPFGDLVPELDANKKYLILGSLQGSKAQQNKSGILNEEFKYKKLNTIAFDLLVADEAHEAFLTPKTAKILDKINRQHDLYLTGTACKLIAQGEFSINNTVSWDLVDREQFLADPRVPEELKIPYKYHPKLLYWAVTLRPEFYKSIAKYFKDGLGFSFQKLLETMGDEQNPEFVNKGDVISTLQYVLGDRDGMLKSPYFPEGTVSKLYQEKTLAYKIKKQLGFDPRCSLFFVGNISQQKALYNLLNTEFKAWLKANNVAVMMTNSQENDSSDVQKLVKELNTYPKRTIVIAVEQLQLGVTIKTCDLVVLMNDSQNVTTIEQCSFRPLSEDLSVDKKFGIVLDLNPARALMVSVMEIRQNIRYKNKSTIEAFKEKHAAIPLFQDGELLDINDQAKVQALLKQVSRQLLERNGIEGYFQLGSSIEGSLNGRLINKLIKLKIPQSPLFQIQDSQIPKGKEYTLNIPKVVKGNKNSDPITQAREVARYLLNSLPWLLLVSKQLGTELNSLQELGEYYSKSPEKIGLFGEVKFKHLFNEVIFGLSSLKGFNSKFYEETLGQFGKVQDINDDIKRFYEDFNSSEINFKFLGNTKNALKNILGQVVTSEPAIKKLVDSIPESAFANPDNTFCDKSCGSGGILMEIFNRLDEGLKHLFPDTQVRHKHILEKMIYGNDIVTKNILICKLRLDPHNKYKLNLQVRNSLTDYDFPKNCFVVSNPATEKIAPEQWTKLKNKSNFKINRIDMVLLDISSHSPNVKSLHYILPLSVTTNKKSMSARQFLNEFNITSTNQLIDKELGTNIAYEFIIVAVDKTVKTKKNLVKVIRGEQVAQQLQSYICDESLPHWVLYRDTEIDLVLNTRQMDCFTAYRDRHLSSKHQVKTRTENVTRVATSSEVTEHGIKPEQAGVSRYVPTNIILPATKALMNQPNLYLAPNLANKTKMVRYERDLVVDGTFAVLKLKHDILRELTDEELAYFASQEFQEFYKKVTNYQNLSKNLDGGFIYWWGLLKKPIIPE